MFIWILQIRGLGHEPLKPGSAFDKAPTATAMKKDESDRKPIGRRKASASLGLSAIILFRQASQKPWTSLRRLEWGKQESGVSDGSRAHWAESQSRSTEESSHNETFWHLWYSHNHCRVQGHLDSAQERDFVEICRQDLDDRNRKCPIIVHCKHDWSWANDHDHSDQYLSQWVIFSRHR